MLNPHKNNQSTTFDQNNIPHVDYILTFDTTLDKARLANTSRGKVKKIVIRSSEQRHFIFLFSNSLLFFLLLRHNNMKFIR